MSLAFLRRIRGDRVAPSNRSSLNSKWTFRLFYLFGIHFFREPNPSDRYCCQRYFGRVSLPNVVLGAFNFAVLLLHLFVGTFPFIFKELFSSLNGAETATLAQELFEAFLPCFCLVILFLNGSQFHYLMHQLQSVSLKERTYRRRFRRWKWLFLAAQFLVSVDIVVAAISRINSPYDEKSHKSLAENHTTADAAFFYFDNTYFSIMSSSLVLGSQIFIALISLFIGYLFVENRERLRQSKKTKTNLTEFFEEYLQLTKLLAQAETCFNKLFLVLVTTSVARIIFAFFLTIKSFSPWMYAASTRETFESDAMDGSLILGEVELDEALGKPEAKVRAVRIVFQSVDLVTTALWSFAYIIPGVFCTESSKSSASLLHDVLLEVSAAKEIKDQILAKIHSVHGLTLSKFMSIDRTVIVTMISISFTVSVVWLQMS